MSLSGSFIIAGSSACMFMLSRWITSVIERTCRTSGCDRAHSVKAFTFSR